MKIKLIMFKYLSGFGKKEVHKCYSYLKTIEEVKHNLHYLDIIENSFRVVTMKPRFWRQNYIVYFDKQSEE